MTNSAYQNALKRQRELLEQVAELQKQLADVERFLRDYHEYSGTPEPPKAPVRTRRRPDSRSPAELAAIRKLAPNPPSDEVARAVELILEKRGHPMTRGKLIQELAEAGIILMGTDPRNLLGTLLFRLRERFVNIPGYGYWIAKRSYTPAGYDPNTWDKMTNEAVKKLRNRMRGAKSE